MNIAFEQAENRMHTIKGGNGGKFSLGKLSLN